MTTSKDEIIAGLTKDVVAMTRELAHWKANHDHIKLHCSVLRDRPDLPADRLKAYQDLCRQIDATNTRAETAESRVTVLEEALSRCADELEESIENEGKLASFKSAAAFARASLSPPTQVAEKEAT